MSERRSGPDLEGSEDGFGGGTRVLQNERIRVRKLRVAPGATSKLHGHTLDTPRIPIEGDKVAVDPPQETGGDFCECIEVAVARGEIAYLDRAGARSAGNAGARLCRRSDSGSRTTSGRLRGAVFVVVAGTPVSVVW